MRKSIEPAIEIPELRMYGPIPYANYVNRWKSGIYSPSMYVIQPDNEECRAHRLPVLIWITGGAWRGVNPLTKIPALSWFAKQGYAVASVAYRVSSEECFPAQIQDVKAAIRFLKAHAAMFNLDPERIAVMGDSAGGHLAALAAVTFETAAFETNDWKEYSSQVKAAICRFGVYDFQYLSETEPEFNRPDSPVSLLLGDSVLHKDELAAQASPSTYLKKGDPPFLILHGECDPVLPVENAEHFYELLTKEGIPAEYYCIKGAGHDTIEFDQPQIQELILDFLNRTV